MIIIFIWGWLLLLLVLHLSRCSINSSLIIANVFIVIIGLIGFEIAPFISHIWGVQETWSHSFRFLCWLQIRSHKIVISVTITTTILIIYTSTTIIGIEIAVNIQHEYMLDLFWILVYLFLHFIDLSSWICSRSTIIIRLLLLDTLGCTTIIVALIIIKTVFETVDFLLELYFRERLVPVTGLKGIQLDELLAFRTGWGCGLVWD